MRLFIVFVIFQISMYVSLNADEINFYTVAVNKVNLRAEPDINAKIFTVLEIGSTAVSKNNKFVKAKIGNIEGNWIYVSAGKLHIAQGKNVPYEGWVFDYYLRKWGTPDGSKGFEKVKKIQLEKNTIELILFERPEHYNITINENGTFHVIIKDNGLLNVKEKGQIYRYRSLYSCNTKNVGFEFYIDDHKYLRIIDIGGSVIKPSKTKVLEEPVVELIK